MYTPQHRNACGRKKCRFRTYTFGEQPNIQGDFEIVELADAYADQYAGRLTVDFTKSSKDKAAYTAIRKEFEGLKLKRYAFWVKTSELKALLIRTTDATGQTYQQKINLQDTTEWQLTLTGLNLGYYTLELSAQSGSEAPVRLKTPFALLSDFDWDAVADSPFGIASHLHRESIG